MKTSLLVGSVLLALVGCSDASQDFVEVDLEVSGTPVEDHELEDLTVTLSRADVAFGPLYLCPGRQAGENCETARLEWTESAVVDGLDEESTKVGVMTGVTGPILSWMFDYGITSLLTQQQPVELRAHLAVDVVAFPVERVAQKAVLDQLGELQPLLVPQPVLVALAELEHPTGDHGPALDQQTSVTGFSGYSASTGPVIAMMARKTKLTSNVL